MSSGPTAGGPADRAAYERMRLRTDPYVRADGSGDPAYLIDALLGRGTQTDNRPYFEPPTGSGWMK